jgi:tetratricopeptide (TPR) repeat protein
VPESPDFYSLLGKVHLVLDDEKAAETAWRTAIDLDQNHLLSYYQLASLYMQMRTYDQAMRQYTAMSQEHPRLASPQMLLGMLHDMQGDHHTANAHYQQALAIHPDFAPAANNLAWNYVQHGGELATALTLAETAYKTLPDNPNVMDTLGWVYYRHEDYRQAVRFLRKSVKQLTDDPVAHYHLGMAYYKRGDKELARDSLRRALQFSQEFPGAQEAQEILRVLEG